MPAIAIENARLHEQVQRLAIVDERERISKDLHDGIIQSIYAVGLSLEDVPELMEEDPRRGRPAGRARDRQPPPDDPGHPQLHLRPAPGAAERHDPDGRPGGDRRGVPPQLDHRRRARRDGLDRGAAPTRPPTCSASSTRRSATSPATRARRGPSIAVATDDGGLELTVDRQWPRLRPGDRGASATRASPTCAHEREGIGATMTIDSGHRRHHGPGPSCRRRGRPTSRETTAMTDDGEAPAQTADAPGRRRPRGRPPGPVGDARPAAGVPGRRRGRDGRRGDRGGPPLPARPGRHGRPAARRLGHRGLPRDPRRDARDPRRDADQLPGRGGRHRRDHRRRQRLPAQAGPRARPRRGARGGRPRRVAARPGGHRQGPRADAPDRDLGRARRARRADPAGAQDPGPRRRGETNKEIAAEVFLSDKTVKNYVSSILAKLNLERRAQAAAYVAKLKGPGQSTS